MLELSTGSGKMKGMCSLNTDTTSNSYCIRMKETDTICKSCYSWRLMKFRTNMVPRFRENSEIISTQRLTGYDFPRPTTMEIRFNSHGELINELHLENLLVYAESYPRNTFTLFTKRKDLVNKVMENRSKPSNCIFIYSNSKVDLIKNSLPKYFDKVFNVVTKKYVEQEKVNCFGKCVECLKCYNLHDKTEQITEHIK